MSTDKKQANGTNQICTFFNSSKGCVRGDKCWFVHAHSPSSRNGSTSRALPPHRDIGKSPRITAQTTSDDKERDSGSSSRENGKKTEACPHFLKGNCLFGDRCRLSHSAPPSTSSTPRLKPSSAGTKPTSSSTTTRSNSISAETSGSKPKPSASSKAAALAAKVDKGKGKVIPPSISKNTLSNKSGSGAQTTTASSSTSAQSSKTSTAKTKPTLAPAPEEPSVQEEYHAWGDDSWEQRDDAPLPIQVLNSAPAQTADKARQKGKADNVDGKMKAKSGSKSASDAKTHTGMKGLDVKKDVASASQSQQISIMDFATSSPSPRVDPEGAQDVQSPPTQVNQRMPVPSNGRARSLDPEPSSPVAVSTAVQPARKSQEPPPSWDYPSNPGETVQHQSWDYPSYPEKEDNSDGGGDHRTSEDIAEDIRATGPKREENYSADEGSPETEATAAEGLDANIQPDNSQLPEEPTLENEYQKASTEEAQPTPSSPPIESQDASESELPSVHPVDSQETAVDHDAIGVDEQQDHEKSPENEKFGSSSEHCEDARAGAPPVPQDDDDYGSYGAHRVDEIPGSLGNEEVDEGAPEESLHNDPHGDWGHDSSEAHGAWEQDVQPNHGWEPYGASYNEEEELGASQHHQNDQEFDWDYNPPREEVGLDEERQQETSQHRQNDQEPGWDEDEKEQRASQHPQDTPGSSWDYGPPQGEAESDGDRREGSFQHQGDDAGSGWNDDAHRARSALDENEQQGDSRGWTQDNDGPQAQQDVQHEEASQATDGKENTPQSFHEALGDVPSTKPAVAGGDSQVCKYFAAGNCVRGSRCFYLHDTSVPPSTGESKPEQQDKPSDSLPKSDIPCWFISHNERCPYGDDCRFSHEVAKPSRTPLRNIAQRDQHPPERDVHLPQPPLSGYDSPSQPSSFPVPPGMPVVFYNVGPCGHDPHCFHVHGGPPVRPGRNPGPFGYHDHYDDYSPRPPPRQYDGYDDYDPSWERRYNGPSASSYGSRYQNGGYQNGPYRDHSGPYSRSNAPPHRYYGGQGAADPRRYNEYGSTRPPNQSGNPYSRRPEYLGAEPMSRSSFTYNHGRARQPNHYERKPQVDDEADAPQSSHDNNWGKEQTTSNEDLTKPSENGWAKNERDLDWANDPWASGAMEARKGAEVEKKAASAVSETGGWGADDSWARDHDPSASLERDEEDGEAQNHDWWGNNRGSPDPRKEAGKDEVDCEIPQSPEETLKEYKGDKTLWPNSTDKVCSYWAQGKCRKGQSCRFLHDGVPSGITTAKEQSVNGDHGEAVLDKWTRDKLKPDMEMRWGDVEFKDEDSDGANTPAVLTRVLSSPQTEADERLPESPRSDGENASSNEGEGLQERTVDELDPGEEEELLTLTHVIHGCKVVFGPRTMDDVQVTTQSESATVVLNDLPKDFPEEDLLELISSSSVPTALQVQEANDGQSSSAVVRFSSPSDAAGAVQSLHRVRFQSSIIRPALNAPAKLLSRSEQSRSRFVLVTWKAPTKTYFAYYTNAGLAKKAEATLNGKLFQGKKLTVEYMKAKKSDTTYAVRIPDVGVDTDVDALKQFCAPCTSLSGGWASYEDPPTPEIRKLLGRVGGPNSGLEVLPPDHNHLDFIGLVRFDTPETAQYVCAHVETGPYKWLGNNSFALKVVFHQRYTIPSSLFQLLRASLNEVISRTQKCTVRYHSLDGVSVILFLYGADSSRFDQAKTAIDRILHGEKLTTSGNAFWHPALRVASASLRPLLIDEINKDPSIFMQVDTRFRLVRLFGDIKRAKEKLAQYIRKSIAVEYVEVDGDTSLESATIIANVMREEGVDVSLDMRTRRLQIVSATEGLSAAMEKINADLDALRKGGERTGDECPLCLNHPTGDPDPIAFSCGHVYCSHCVEMLLHPIDIHERPHFSCVSPQGLGGADADDPELCAGRLPFVHIQARLFPELEQLDPYLEVIDPAIANQRLRTWFCEFIFQEPDPSLSFCPTEGCEIIHRRGGDAIVHCPGCEAWICLACWVGHEGVSCSEHQEIVALVSGTADG